MGQYRIQRLNDQLRDEISQLILRGEVKDPRVNTFLSVNRVEVTSDLSYAKVYVSSCLSWMASSSALMLLIAWIAFRVSGIRMLRK